MRVKTLAHKNNMGKSKTTNASTNWVPSEFAQVDLAKAQKDGLIAEGDQVIFPSTDRIPKPPSGYRVMFLTFLLRGLSFPTHKIPSWASLCIRRAASPAHAKLNFTHCLFCHSL
jgi:hypothetical protein